MQRPLDEGLTPAWEHGGLARHCGSAAFTVSAPNAAAHSHKKKDRARHRCDFGFVLRNSAAMLDGPSVALVVGNFLTWGHWPVFARIGRAPSQPFGVVMVVAQVLCAWLACFANGAAFLEALNDDSSHVVCVLCVVAGGAALAVGDFAAAAGIEHLGVAVGGPVCFSCSLIVGGFGDFLFEGSAHPALLFCGLALCICAVIADSQSHAAQKAEAVDRITLTKADGAAVTEAAPAAPPTPAQHEIEMSPSPPDTSLADGKQAAAADSSARRGSDFRLGMMVAVGGGCIGGLWTVLSTLASRVHATDPLVLLFYFHLGELLFIVPVVIAYGHLFGGVTTVRQLAGMMRSLTRKQMVCAAAAGSAIAIGYLCYFATESSIPRSVAYAFGCTSGVTSMIWGLFYFKEYAGAPRHKKALLLLALLLYPSAISLIARSMA